MENKVSRLLLQSGQDFVLYEYKGKQYKLRHPVLQDIIDLEKERCGKYFDYLYTLVSTVEDVADILYIDHNIWYEDIKSNWEFFLSNMMSKDYIDIIYQNNKDGTIADIYTRAALVDERGTEALNYFLRTTGKFIFWCDEANAENPSELYIANISDQNEQGLYVLHDGCYKITEATYNYIVSTLRQVHWIHPEYDFLYGGTKKAKKYILKNERRKRDVEAKRDPKIDLSSIISSLVARGQNYNDILSYSVYLIYELYYRVNKLDEWNNTMRGLYSGAIDTKKNPINWDKINWSQIIKP